MLILMSKLVADYHNAGAGEAVYTPSRLGVPSGTSSHSPNHTQNLWSDG